MGGYLTRNRESKKYSKCLYSILIIRSRYVCCKCNIHFNAKRDLDEHMERAHVGATYTCDYCNLIYETWSKFEEHIYIFHNDNTFCSYCYKAYSDYSSLLLHWKMHEPFKYEICNDTFQCLPALKNHHTTLHQNVSFKSRTLPFSTREEDQNYKA